MKIPIEVTFLQKKPMLWLEYEILNHVEELDNAFEGIESCRVLITSPETEDDLPFRLAINLTVSGKEMTIESDLIKRGTFAEIKDGVKSAFDSMKQKLETSAKTKPAMAKSA